jgi:hypothetical protein
VERLGNESAIGVGDHYVFEGEATAAVSARKAPASHPSPSRNAKSRTVHMTIDKTPATKRATANPRASNPAPVTAAKAKGPASFMMELTHARKAEVERLRIAIAALPLGLTEHIKWNAPSFCMDGEDRITFRLQPGDRVELIFHRGAKKRADTATFTFIDPSGLMKLLAPDRGVVVLADAAATDRHTPDILRLVEAWVTATKPSG